MKPYKILKWWCLSWVAIGAVSAIAYIAMREWERAMFAVVCCAINHFCYDFYKKLPN